MLRRLFTLSAVLSLLLCLTTAALWVRSYYATESLRWAKGDLWQNWTCGHGRVLYLRATGRVERQVLNRQLEPPSTDVAGSQWLVKHFEDVAGFAYGTGSGLGHQGAGLTRTLSPPLGADNTTAYISGLLRPEGTLGNGGLGGFFGLYLNGLNGTGDNGIKLAATPRSYCTY